MQAHAVKAHGRVYHYMRCPLHLRTSLKKCPVNARLPAEKAEEAVWEFVVRLLVQPERMISGVENLIEEERLRLSGNPEQEIRGLRRQLHDLDLRHERAKEAYLAGEFSVDELRVRRQRTEEAKEEVMRQLEATENRGERLRRLIDLRNRLQQREAIWGRLRTEHPDLSQYVVEGFPLP